mgnify:CR=1 FL=1
MMSFKSFNSQTIIGHFKLSFHFQDTKAYNKFLFQIMTFKILRINGQTSDIWCFFYLERKKSIFNIFEGDKRTYNTK